MPQEPNARHRELTLRRPPPICLHLSRAKTFSASFPSTTTLFLFCRSLRNGVFRYFSLSLTFPSSVPEETSSFVLASLPIPLSSDNLPATSREFYKTFHASLTASVSFPPTKQRILVWIEFLMEPIPSGSRPTPTQPSHHPAFLCDVRGYSRVHGSRCDDFLPHRFPRARDTSSNEVDDGRRRKGCA